MVSHSGHHVHREFLIFSKDIPLVQVGPLGSWVSLLQIEQLSIHNVKEQLSNKLLETKMLSEEQYICLTHVDQLPFCVDKYHQIFDIGVFHQKTFHLYNSFLADIGSFHCAIHLQHVKNII